MQETTVLDFPRARQRTREEERQDRIVLLSGWWTERGTGVLLKSEVDAIERLGFDDEELLEECEAARRRGARTLLIVYRMLQDRECELLKGDTRAPRPGGFRPVGDYASEAAGSA